VDWITIVDEPQRLRSENGVVYSTQPLVAYTTDDRRYVLKGPSPNIVAAEAIGYMLAGFVGIPTPPFGLCRHPGTGEVHFASEMMSVRSIESCLSVPGLVENPEVVVDCVALDVWLANVDRNIGGFVGEIVSNQPLRVRAFSIDFERCSVLNGTSPIMVNALEPRKLQSSDAAIQRLLEGKKFPSDACSRIARVSSTSIESAFAEVSAAIQMVPWRSGADIFVHQRAQNIATLAAEVWNA
jgi:hypothetical protein